MPGQRAVGLQLHREESVPWVLVIVGACTGETGNGAGFVMNPRFSATEKAGRFGVTPERDDRRGVRQAERADHQERSIEKHGEVSIELACSELRIIVDRLTASVLPTLPLHRIDDPGNLPLPVNPDQAESVYAAVAELPVYVELIRSPHHRDSLMNHDLGIPHHLL